MIPPQLGHALKCAFALSLLVTVTGLTSHGQVITQSLTPQGRGNARSNTGDNPDVRVIELPGAGGSLRLRSGTRRTKEILASQGFGGEIEPNDTFGAATPLGGSNVVVRANIFPATDIDFYSFTAAAGDRVYAATMPSFAPPLGPFTDSQLTLLAADGTTVIEFDDDNGSLGTFSSSIAGATIPAPGTYFIKVNDFTASIGTPSAERPYELHFRIQTGVPTPEVEANDTPATANPYRRMAG
jgi:Bacterial pre-peptidase C-terminal domain